MEKPWKIGLWTIAVGCIAIGVIIILHSLGIGAAYRVLQYVWPLLLIAFGLEIVWHRARFPEQRLRFGGWSIVLIIIVFFASLADFGVTRAATKVNTLTDGAVISGDNVLSWFVPAAPEVVTPVHGTVKLQPGIQSIEIKIPDADVTITPGPDGTASYDGKLGVVADSSSAAAKALSSQWSVTQDGSTLELTLQLPNNERGKLPAGSKPYLNVTVPASLATDVHIAVGFVHVSDMKSSADLYTAVGNITAQRLTGNVTETSVNGDCKASDIGGTLSAKTVNGDIAFTDAQGGVSANNVNGQVNGTSNIAGDWNIHTVNGGISLSLPASVDAAFHATTVNGGIGGSIGWQMTDNSHHHATATLGSGKFNVTMQTVNGGIGVNQ